MDFLSKLLRRHNAEPPMTREEAQQNLELLCKRLVEFHKCISDSYRAFTKHIRAVEQPPHTATALIDNVEPNLSVNLVMPLREFKKRTAGGRILEAEEAAKIFPDDMSDCLFVADMLIKAIAARMEKYVIGDPAYEELYALANNLLGQRIVVAGKPESDVIAALARAWFKNNNTAEAQRVVDELFDGLIVKGGGGLTLFERVDVLRGSGRGPSSSVSRA